MMKILTKNQTRLLFIFVLEILLLSYQYLGGKPDHAWPDSDASVFPLMALHLMQDGDFSPYFYGQDYIGTFPVLIIAGLFKLLGVSHLWVDVLYAVVYSGIITIISAFLIRKTGFIPVLVFAISYAFFPSELSIPRALDSGTHNFSIFSGLLTGYIFSLFIDAKLSNQDNLWRNNYFGPGLTLLLGVLAYWSSPLGFISVIAIIMTVLFSCRKQLFPRFFEKLYSFDMAKKWWWLILLITVLTGLVFFEERFLNVIFNIFLITKIYFLHLFVRIPEPMNYFWSIIPFMALFFVVYKERALLKKMWQGRAISPPWHLVLLSTPIFNVIFALPTSDHLEDYSSARYFESLQWMNLYILPLLFAVLFRSKIKNQLSIIYLVFAVFTWYSEQDEDYSRLQNPSETLQFIQLRQNDMTRLLDDEKTVIDFLDKRKLYYGFSDYWLAYRLTWLSHEKFIISPYKDSRYPAYDERIKKQGIGFFLFYIEELGDGREIANQHGKLKAKTFGELILFY